MLRKKGLGAAGEGVVVVELSGPAGGGAVRLCVCIWGPCMFLGRGDFDT